MLKRALWDKLKEKLVKLPAENRLAELKVLLVSTTDKTIMIEVNELIEKAKIEAAELPWREKFQNFSIGSRLKNPVPEEGAARPKAPELEQIVREVPSQPSEAAEVSYTASDSGYDAKDYLTEEYAGLGSGSLRMSSDVSQREREEVEEPRKSYVTE